MRTDAPIHDQQRETHQRLHLHISAAGPIAPPARPPATAANERPVYVLRVVTDNDSAQSSQQVVADFAGSSGHAVKYSCEPRQNIALARNEALNHATGEFVAFIDDDEYPENDWLAVMLAACETYHAAGVLGPVRPRFEETPPRWIVDGRFWDRPEHPTGWIMDWPECRTGNALFRRHLLDGMQEAFNPKFRTGGEDVDFFRRLIKQGHVFRWC